MALFALLPPRKAFLWVALLGWLFLPVASIRIPVIADYGKFTAVGFALMIGTVIFHPILLLNFRLKWYDIPALLWPLCQFPASIANGYGIYDGTSQFVNHFMMWTMPYVLTRCYFTKAEYLREVATAVVVAGMIYVPLCAFELRMSPKLHLTVYGYYAAPFFDMVRLGGYRPIVFMNHGLALALMMCGAAFIAGWFWYFGAVQKIGRFHIRWVALALAVIAVLTKSSGALMIFAFLLGLVVVSRVSRLKWVLLLPILLMPAYMFGRTMELTDGRFMLDATQAIFRAEDGRDGSVIARLIQEDQVVALIREKPLTGWGNWGPGQDQLWLLLGRNTGMISLACWVLAFSLPLILVVLSDWRQRRDLFLFGVPLGLVCIAFVMDGLFNGMFNPLWVICSAAVMTAATEKEQNSALDATRRPRHQKAGSLVAPGSAREKVRSAQGPATLR